jgi:hypothetical protein
VVVPVPLGAEDGAAVGVCAEVDAVPPSVARVVPSPGVAVVALPALHPASTRTATAPAAGPRTPA